VAQAHIKTQPGAFGLTGGGIKIGRDSGQPASSDYQSPFDFSGGNIKDVIVDVSGERYRDLLKESQAMLVRE